MIETRENGSLVQELLVSFFSDVSWESAVVFDFLQRA